MRFRCRLQRDWSISTLAVALLVVAILAMVAPLPALAQGERTFEQMSKVSDAAVAAAQKKLVADLKQFAARHAKPGSVEYWAIIQANLAMSRRTMVEPGGERSLSSLQRRFEVPSADRKIEIDERTQKSLEDFLNQIEKGERIFGGEKARGNEFTEVVAIANRISTGSGFASFCTGTLIGEGTVLTAGHCVCGSEFTRDPLAAVVFGTDVNLAGEIVVAYESTGVATMQPEYCDLFNDPARRPEANRDIAIVRFDPTSAPIAGKAPSSGLKPGRLASWQFMFGQELSELQLVGFGLTEDAKIGTGQKRFTVTRVAEAVCRPGSQYHCMEGAEIVAIDAMKQRDTCQGDSGGPAFVSVGKESFLAAVTSRGGKCGTGGIYSLITPRVMAWLRTTVRVDTVMCDSPSRCFRSVR